MSNFKDVFFDQYGRTPFYIGSFKQPIYIDNPPSGPQGFPGVTGKNAPPATNGLNFESIHPPASVSYFGTVPNAGISIVESPSPGVINLIPIDFNLISQTDPILPPKWDNGNPALSYNGPDIKAQATFNLTLQSKDVLASACMVKNNTVIPGTKVVNNIIDPDIITHQMSGTAIIDLMSGDQIGIAATALPTSATPVSKLIRGQNVNITFKVLTGTLR